ncbi:hypothetical protein KC723_02075 [Candidatus Kaiserbacteria bacterium]|nr:hypothetical protein [Candidatus Kaiserbacteria bacterium]
MNNIQEKILNKIQSGEVYMKPKWHFVLRTGLLLCGVVIVLLLAVYFLSFAIFFMHQNGIWLASDFGFRGVSFFVMSSPWLIISTSLAFIILLYVLVHKYSFSYKRPLVYSMLLIVVVAVIGSLLMNKTFMHQRLGNIIEGHQVPMLSPMYRGAMQERPEGVLVGTVVELLKEGFVIKSEKDEFIVVTVTEKTKLPPDIKIQSGDTLIVFGDRKGDYLTAFGVKTFDKEKLRPFKNNGKQNGQLKKVKENNPS